MLLDPVDAKILEFLKADGRMPFLKIAKELNVSESTVRKRVSKLKAKGIIRAFTVALDSNLSFESIVAIKCLPKATKSVAEKIGEINSLMPVVEVTGRYDIFCTISTPTARELNSLIDKIRAFTGVLETESFLVVEKR